MTRVERQRIAKREYMRRARRDPEKRDRWNASRRKNRHRYAPKQKAALATMRKRRFFHWRARLHRMRYNTDITARDLARLWRRQRGRCALTGRRLNRKAHLDHVVAVSAGGSHDIENLRWTCAAANRAKRELTDDEFVALCGDVIEWIGRRIVEHEAE